MKLTDKERPTVIAEITKNLTPQIKRESFKLRMKYANVAQYHSQCPNDPYSVRVDNQLFKSDDTGELIDQVMKWLKMSVEDRANDILERA